MQEINDVRAWRKQYRWECVARREAVEPARLREWKERITGLLLDALPVGAGTVVGFCWPIRNEPDARFALHRWRENGACGALPVVAEKKGPLRFHEWHPGVRMVPGVHDIPYPEGSPEVVPDLALVPMNAFDEQGFRLGYGGGYFDRTLAALDPRPVAVGLCFEQFRVGTIHPQEHDVPMDFVVTEEHVYRAGGRPLSELGAGDAAREYAQLLRERGLPRARSGPAR